MTGRTAGDREVQILDAACRTIARRGVKSVRVEDVAAEAGVSPALVRHYAGPRAQLVLRALRRADLRATLSPLARVDVRAPGAEQVRQLIAASMDDRPEVRDNWVLWGEASAGALFDDDVRDVAREWVDRLVAAFADLIRRGQADGSIPSDVATEDAAARLAGLLQSLGLRTVVGTVSRKDALEVLAQAAAAELSGAGRPAR